MKSQACGLKKASLIFILCVLCLSPYEDAAAQLASPAHGRTKVIGRQHPARLAGLAADGITVETRDIGQQVVRFTDIWRVRRALTSDEPSGACVIDFANNRLFVAASVADVTGMLGQHLQLVQFTSPGGDRIYLVANRVTDVYEAQPALHNPASKTVVGTRYGTQQIQEPIETVQQAIAAARITP